MVLAHAGETGTDHRSVVGTLAKSRTYVWVVKVLNLAKKAVDQCMVCKISRRKLESQRMARIRSEQLTVSPPWTTVSLDFEGPVLVKGEVEARKKVKTWILIYCNMAS